MAIRLKGNRKYPSIPVVTEDPKNHASVLIAIKESLEIGQRRTPDLMNSFIRVQDLIDLGIIDIKGNTDAIVGADLSQIADIGDLTGSAEGDFLRFRSGEWVNDQLSNGDIVEVMVTQHEAALTIDWGQLTGVPATTTTLLYQRGATWANASDPITPPVMQIALYFPRACTITGVSVLTLGGAGSCVIDIWKVPIGSYPPDVGDSIVASAKPTISTGLTYVDTMLTGWDTSIDAGDTLFFELESSSVFTSIFCSLDLSETV